jgi:lipopolysaccharide biosynthesis glycosyltransferase
MVVDIAFSLNRSIAVGLLAVMNSIQQNTPSPQRLRFNIAVRPEEHDYFHQLLSRHFPETNFAWRLAQFEPPAYLADYLNQKFKPATATQQNSRYMQYARLFLASLFPDVTKVIYLDVDTIVLDDITALFDGTNLTEARYLAAVPQLFPAMGYFNKPWRAWSEISAFEQAFNSGLLVTDLSHWTDPTYTRIRHYLDWDRQYNYRMLNLGDETLLNLVFKQYLHLDPRWNRCGYGNLRPIAWLLKKNLKEIGMIHWSGGHHKPWHSPNITYGSIWRQYAIPLGNGLEKNRELSL